MKLSRKVRVPSKSKATMDLSAAPWRTADVLPMFTVTTLIQHRLNETPATALLDAYSAQALVVGAAVGDCQGLDNLRRISCTALRDGNGANGRWIVLVPSRSEKPL